MKEGMSRATRYFLCYGLRVRRDMPLPAPSLHTDGTPDLRVRTAPAARTRPVPAAASWYRSESRGRDAETDATGTFIPLSSAKGFRARLRLALQGWNAGPRV